MQFNKNYLIGNIDLMDEWNWNKNENLNPKTLTCGSGKKVWWICKNGHEWNDIIYNRTKRDRNCPYCSNKKVLVGYNDLATTNPELLKEWDYYKNKNINPQTLMKTSWKKVWWICKKGHSYEASVVIKLKPNRGCPYCSGQRVLKGFNDIATTNPEILKYWNYDKNDKAKLYPTLYSRGSNIKVWWICEKGHEYKQSIVDKINSKNCLICNRQKQTSFPEQILFFYLKNIFKDAINRYRLDGKYEYDIYIPSLSLGIEYDGLFYHKNNKKVEEKKDLYALSKGIDVIRIKETKIKKENQKNIFYFVYDPNYNYLKEAIIIILNIINKKLNSNFTVDYNFSRDALYIEEQYLYLENENSIAKKFPEITCEWDYEKNGKIKPEYVNQMSKSKYWWKCKKGHSFYASVSSRTNLKSGCPYCSNQKVIIGYNDLATTNPELLKEWNYERNMDITPQSVTAGSGKKVWWSCKNGHEWKTSIAKRSNGRNCPYCSNKKILAGYNDLATTNPELLKEWNYEKNKNISPLDLTKKSNIKVWWICKNGHEWKASLNSRNRTGCPYCSNQKVIAGYNDLATTNPELLKEWNYERNMDITPQSVTSGSGKKVWWKCKNGHEWEISIAKRSNGRNCPYCSNKKVLVGYNDLATTNPELLKEWNYERNIDITPQSVTAGSGKKVWWKCKNGHEWLSSIYNRKRGRNCPVCNRIKDD